MAKTKNILKRGGIYCSSFQGRNNSHKQTVTICISISYIFIEVHMKLEGENLLTKAFDLHLVDIGEVHPAVWGNGEF